MSLHDRILKAISIFMMMVMMVAISIVDTDWMFPYVHIVIGICALYFALLAYANGLFY